MTRIWASIAGGIGVIVSHLTAYFRGKRAGRNEALAKAAKKAVRRGDAAALKDIIEESHK